MSKELKEKIQGTWVLDDGKKLYHYSSSTTLATALYAGYGDILPRNFLSRVPSVQWFGHNGWCDLSEELLNEKYPNNHPSPNDSSAAKTAHKKAMSGDQTEWRELQKIGAKADALERKKLVQKIERLRTAKLTVS